MAFRFLSISSSLSIELGSSHFPENTRATQRASNRGCLDDHHKALPAFHLLEQRWNLKGLTANYLLTKQALWIYTLECRIDGFLLRKDSPTRSLSTSQLQSLINYSHMFLIQIPLNVHIYYDIILPSNWLNKSDSCQIISVRRKDKLVKIDFVVLYRDQILRV